MPSVRGMAFLGGWAARLWRPGAINREFLRDVAEEKGVHSDESAFCQGGSEQARGVAAKGIQDLRWRFRYAGHCGTKRHGRASRGEKDFKGEPLSFNVCRRASFYERGFAREVKKAVGGWRQNEIEILHVSRDIAIIQVRFSP